MAASIPETAWGLSAVNPDMAKLLAVVALRMAILGFVRLSFNYDMTKAGTGTGTGCITAYSLSRSVWSRYRSLYLLMNRFSLNRRDTC